MSIKYFWEKSKHFLDENNDTFIVLIVILTAFGSFGLGRLSKTYEMRTPVRIENMGASVINTKNNSSKRTLSVNRTKTTKEESVKNGGGYVGAKNGSRYYYPWCSGVKRIKNVNKIVFKTKAQAIKAGYTPSKKCKGLN